MLALSAFVLWEALDVPANMLWQTLIGLNILSPLNLFQPGVDLARRTCFLTTNQRSIRSHRRILLWDPKQGICLPIPLAQIAPRRPFLICNMAMFLNETGTDFQLLAPVQMTAFTTGIMGLPQGTDNNGLAPGGGGVTSFAFNSIFVSRTATPLLWIKRGSGR